VVDSSTAVRRSAVLTDMLDAPVAKLTVSNDINACKNLLNARTLD